MSKQLPTNTLVITYILGTFLAGIISYALWRKIAPIFHLPEWIYFLAYSLSVPTMGFYRALKWGYWLSKNEGSL